MAFRFCGYLNYVCLNGKQTYELHFWSLVVVDAVVSLQFHSWNLIFMITSLSIRNVFCQHLSLLSIDMRRISSMTNAFFWISNIQWYPNDINDEETWKMWIITNSLGTHSSPSNQNPSRLLLLLPRRILNANPNDKCLLNQFQKSPHKGAGVDVHNFFYSPWKDKIQKDYIRSRSRDKL